MRKMKKFALGLLASFVLFNSFVSVYAEDSEDSSDESSSSQVESQTEEESMESQEESKDTEKSESKVRTIDLFGEDLDEGNIYETDLYSGRPYSYITVANVRYNEEYLFLDVRLDIAANPSNTLDTYLTGEREGKSIFRIYQEVTTDSVDSNELSSEPVRLRPSYNNLPEELMGKLRIPNIKTVTKNYSKDDEDFEEFTLPYKFELPLDTASKLIFIFGNEEVEVDLEADAPVI